MIKQIISQPPGESKYFLLRKTNFSRRDLRRKAIHRTLRPEDSHAGLITGPE